MSKVQYVGGKNMTSYKCVMSFRRKVAILFIELLRVCLKCVRKNDLQLSMHLEWILKRKKHC